MAKQRRELNFSTDKFKCFIRYMILAARNKRCVTYSELENSCGLSHKQAGVYAGQLGEYCFAMKLPLLNGLIIGSTNCCPSRGFNQYKRRSGKQWEQIVIDCWKHFHITSSRIKQVRDFSRLDNSIEEFCLGPTKK